MSATDASNGTNHFNFNPDSDHYQLVCTLQSVSSICEIIRCRWFPDREANKSKQLTLSEFVLRILSNDSDSILLSNTKFRMKSSDEYITFGQFQVNDLIKGVSDQKILCPKLIKAPLQESRMLGKLEWN